MSTPIDFYLNEDNSADVFWIDTGDKDSQWNITRHNSFSDPEILELIKIPSSVNQTGKFLGFAKKELDNTYFLAYSKDNKFAVRDNDGKCVRVNSSSDNCDGEYWLSGFDKNGVEKFNTSVFGDVDLTIPNVSGDNTKGNPGGASVGTILYHASTDKLIAYTGHKQRFSDNVRHQAGWIGSYNSDGRLHSLLGGWYSSHNFDQRLHISDDSSIYTLAHGDAFPRSLILGKWDVAKSKHIFDYYYYDIKNGTTGQNATLSDTGDVAVIDNDRVAIAFSTEDSRSSRDVVMKILSGLKYNDASKIKEDVNVWLTNYGKDIVVGKGIKVISAKDKIMVMWNEYYGSNTDKNKKGDYLKTQVRVFNFDGTVIGTMSINDKLMPTQSLKLTKDKKEVVWVTSTDNSELIFHKINFDLI
ncbi:hypothetical protein ACB087_09955 (plasmid) [Vibrio sp. VNB-15]